MADASHGLTPSTVTGEVRHADGLADQLRAKLRREVLRLPAILLGAVDQKTPAIPAVDGEEGGAQILLLDKIQRGRPMLDPLGEVGLEQDIDAVVDFLFADHVDAQRAADAALRAFGGDQIARGERRLLAGDAIGQHAGDGAAASG